MVSRRDGRDIALQAGIDRSSVYDSGDAARVPVGPVDIALADAAPDDGIVSA